MKRSRPWTRRAFAFTAALLAVAFAAKLPAAEAIPQAAAVKLMIDYGDGTVKTISGIPWKSGTTVLDVMNAAKVRPHGVTFEYRGSGATALLTAIDGVANQGGGGSRRNWQLWVNDTYADRGFGVYETQAQDVVSWRFGAPNSGPNSGK